MNTTDVQRIEEDSVFVKKNFITQQWRVGVVMTHGGTRMCRGEEQLCISLHNCIRYVATALSGFLDIHISVTFLINARVKQFPVVLNQRVMCWSSIHAVISQCLSGVGVGKMFITCVLCFSASFCSTMTQMILTINSLHCYVYFTLNRFITEEASKCLCWICLRF